MLANICKIKNKVVVFSKSKYNFIKEDSDFGRTFSIWESPFNFCRVFYSDIALWVDFVSPVAKVPNILQTLLSKICRGTMQVWYEIIRQKKRKMYHDCQEHT